MLIHAQKPDATLVAGFNKWKNSFGRHVKKGEKGIQILAPTPYKIKQEEQKLDPDTKLPLLDKNGEPVTEEKEITIPMFKVVSVFDVSQTDGRPLPQISSTLTGDVAEYEVFLEALHRTSPVPISFQAMEPGMDGYFAPKKQEIFLREGMSQVQTICAAVHEIAHSKLHDYEHMTELADDGETILVPGEKSRNTEEVEAESVSYAVCQYFGIETAENSFGYIATWSQGKELKDLRASLETITKTSSELITGIERHYREICKERGIQTETQEQDTTVNPEVLPPESAPEAVPSSALPKEQKPEYRLISNFYSMDAKETTYVQKYLPSDGAFTPGEILYLGTYEKCLEIQEKLKDGTMAELDVKGLNDTEKLYIISDKTYLHIQKSDNGFDYTLYDKDTFRLIDGGEIGSPEQHIYSACLAICDRHGLDSYAVKYASMELIEKLQEAQTVSSEQLPLPDPTITPDMAEQCGYAAPDMFPLSKDRAMELLEKDVVIFTLYPDKPAEMVFDAEDIVSHDGFFGITREDWQNIHDTVPNRDVHQRFLDALGDAYAIMQLKQDAPADLRFMGLKSLSRPPLPDNYDTIYTGPIVRTQDQAATLENLFETFNVNRPMDFTGHSLSVSDIVALKQDGVVSYHYCDSFGFQELPSFMSENYLKAAEMSMEDDYGMIDGIINNGQKPTLSDLEQQVKSGQSISLMDLAEAIQREKKPSVLKKLREQPPQSASKRKLSKTKEQEI